MNKEQAAIMKNGDGFIAALDQSGGSTPKALARYGIPKDQYDSEKEMFDLVHQMRTRIITSPAFSSDYILAAILFEKTMDSKIEGLFSGDYLWEKKGIIPILKVDSGLREEENGVQLMKPIMDLDNKLKRAHARNIFGTKMRSVIKMANSKGIKDIVEQQFYYAKKIISAGFIPILEPEVDIHSDEKAESEAILKREIMKHLDTLDEDELIMLKLSIPSEPDFYKEVIEHPNVVRVVALSGGYSQEDAVNKLAENHNMIASFSRALLQDLQVDQSEEEFDKTLKAAVVKIYEASIT